MFHCNNSQNKILLNNDSSLINDDSIISPSNNNNHYTSNIINFNKRKLSQSPMIKLVNDSNHTLLNSNYHSN